MIIVQYMWEYQGDDSFSGLHVALFEDLEQADHWLEDMKTAAVYTFEHRAKLRVVCVVEKDLTAMIHAAVDEVTGNYGEGE